ncbi:MAG: glucosamine-6-phosphate deaminase, partial [Akkermansiaceae bacterium]|nr:glucosamine-6-phosphate deaminase [Akkermansiaceae bacterium]
MMSQVLAHRVFPTAEAASNALAAEIAELIRSRSAKGRKTVLGLATGGTPTSLYHELVRLHREEGLSFAHVITFNLDEYLDLPRDHPESYWTFMHRHLFDQVDIPPGNIHIPDGTANDPEAVCTSFESAIRDAGGIDLQILGIGRNGHIGFNEPGSPAGTRTRVVELSQSTTHRAAEAFGGVDNVPQRAITMGVATILDARRIVLLAFGN